MVEDADVPTFIIPKSTDIGTTDIVGGNAPAPKRVTIILPSSGSFEDIVILEEKLSMVAGANFIVI